MKNFDMANQYFEFKRFRVEQGGASMKVGTDGVLLGAWTPVDGCTRILDIGTGTGLIALMLAQRNSHATIDAIEIDASASVQAKANVAQSSWMQRICVKNESLQDYMATPNAIYDLIVCNPPFFSNSLKSPFHQRNLARHNNSLSLEDLADGVGCLLGNEGRFSVVLPPDQMELLSGLLKQKGLSPEKKMDVVPVPLGDVKRVMALFSNCNVEPFVEELVIESDGRHGYSERYKQLTRDFYLQF